jgi:hypothetical protein
MRSFMNTLGRGIGFLCVAALVVLLVSTAKVSSDIPNTQPIQIIP